jgi:ribosomal protein S27AE
MQTLPSSTSSKKDVTQGNASSSIVIGIGKGSSNTGTLLNLKKKKSMQTTSIPVAHVNMSDKNLIKFCTRCGWQFKHTNDRYCGECGATRKEK